MLRRCFCAPATTRLLRATAEQPKARSGAAAAAKEVRELVNKEMVQQRDSGFKDIFFPLLIGTTVLFYAWNMRTKAATLQDANRELLQENEALKLELRNLHLRQQRLQAGDGSAAPATDTGTGTPNQTSLQ